MGETLASQGMAATGGTGGRRTVGLIGQYGALVLLAVIVLGPILFTLVYAVSVPTTYIAQGKPLHPVAVAWLDRTWLTGGANSVVFRTVIVFLSLVGIQRVAAGEKLFRVRTPLRREQWAAVAASVLVVAALYGPSWSPVHQGDARQLWLVVLMVVLALRAVAGAPWVPDASTVRPERLLAVVGGTVAIVALLGPAFRSLHRADGKSQWWVLGAMVVVAGLQAVGFAARRSMRPISAAIAAAGFSILLVGGAVFFVGPAAWTTAYNKGHLGHAMVRSFTMAILITVLQVTTSIASAYAFVFLRFPFKKVLFALFMGTLLLPLEVTLVGNVAFIRQIHWIDTMQALVIPFAASALGTFLIRQGFRGLPPDIQDATKIDGYGHLSFLTKFAVPLTRPVIASFTVISALQAWNQYLWPRSVIQTDSANTLQIQLRTLISQNIAAANLTVAGALIAAVPVALLLVAFQRQIIRGLTAGAVK